MGKLAVIRRCGHYLPYTLRKLMYKTFVLPSLDYCSVVWHYCGSTLTQRVEKIQNYAMRMILRKPPQTSSAYLREALKWTTLKNRRTNGMATQVHRCRLKQAPTYLNSKFTVNNEFHHIQTRGAQKLHIPKPLSNYFHSSFEFQGAMIYNALPDYIRDINTLGSFRSALTRLSLFKNQ